MVSVCTDVSLPNTADCLLLLVCVSLTLRVLRCKSKCQARRTVLKLDPSASHENNKPPLVLFVFHSMKRANWGKGLTCVIKQSNMETAFISIICHDRKLFMNTGNCFSSASFSCCLNDCQIAVSPTRSVERQNFHALRCHRGRLGSNP